jgi:hypothetical protein
MRPVGARLTAMAGCAGWAMATLSQGMFALKFENRPPHNIYSICPKNNQQPSHIPDTFSQNDRRRGKGNHARIYSYKIAEYKSEPFNDV